MAETATERGETHVSAYWDLKKAFEMVDRSKLAQVAPLTHYPMLLMRRSLAGYLGARTVAHQGIAGRPVVAGCGCTVDT